MRCPNFVLFFKTYWPQTLKCLQTLANISFLFSLLVLSLRLTSSRCWYLTRNCSLLILWRSRQKVNDDLWRKNPILWKQSQPVDKPCVMNIYYIPGTVLTECQRSSADAQIGRRSFHTDMYILASSYLEKMPVMRHSQKVIIASTTQSDKAYQNS